MKNILITRSQNRSKKLKDTLEHLGFKVFIEPLFSIKKNLLDIDLLKKEVPQILYFAKVVKQKILIKIFPVKNAMYLWGLTTKTRILSGIKMYQIILLHQL